MATVVRPVLVLKVTAAAAAARERDVEILLLLQAEGLFDAMLIVFDRTERFLHLGRFGLLLLVRRRRSLLLLLLLLVMKRFGTDAAGTDLHWLLMTGRVLRIDSHAHTVRELLLLLLLLLQLLQVLRFERYHYSRHRFAAAELVRFEEHVVHDRQRHHRLLHRAAGQLVTVHHITVTADGRVHLMGNRHGHHDAVIVGRRLFYFRGLDGHGRHRRCQHLERLNATTTTPERVSHWRQLLQGVADRLVVQPFLPGRWRFVVHHRHGVAEVEMVHFR